MYMNDVFTVPASMAGIPGISVPVGLSKRLAAGRAVLGKPFEEVDVCSASRRRLKPLLASRQHHS